MQELSPVLLNKQTMLSKTSSTRRTSNGTPGKRPTKQISTLRKSRLIKRASPKSHCPLNIHCQLPRRNYHEIYQLAEKPTRLDNDD